jgi:DNA-binding XRE family transcriptional regulator
MLDVSVLKPKEIADHVRRYRFRRVMTRQEFARGAGITRKTLRQMEAGEEVRDITVAKVARAYPEVFQS